MIGSEILTAFDQYYDKITNFQAPGYLEAEKLLFLNNAQDEFVKERTFGKNFQPPAFDDNPKRVADIRSLVAHGSWALTEVSVYGTNSKSLNLYDEDSSFLYLMKASARITRTNPVMTAEYIPCREIKLGEAEGFKDTTLNRTWFKNPVYFSIRNIGLVIIADYYTTVLDYAKVEYVRQPYPITAAILDFNGTFASGYMSLESHVHQEIVDMAVRSAMHVSKDQRYQTQIAEGQIKSE